MKNLILLVTLITLGLSSKAQSPLNLAGKVGVGYSIVKPDYSSSSLITPETEEIGKLSYSLGGMARVKLKKLSIQGEALFVYKSGEIEETTNATETTSIAFSTIDFPVLVGYKLLDAKIAKVRLNAGVIPSLTVIKASGDLGEDFYKDSYISAAGGISLDIPLLVFDLRYQHGLGDFYEVDFAGISSSMKNNLITFSIGYKFM